MAAGHGLAMEVASAPDVGSTREEQWPPGEVTSGGEEQVNAIGDQELLVNDVDITEAMPKALPEAGNPGNRKRWAACEPAN